MTHIGQAWEITVPVMPYKQYGYKFTRGYWTTVEKGPAGEEIANRPLMVTADHTQMDTVANWADIPVSVRAEIGNLPKSFMLSQNYPNPFNPTTTINFDVPEAIEVTINIYNLLGWEVKLLADGQYQPGSYTVSWEGTDNTGNKVSSGLYIYQIKAGDFVATKKMMLLK
jgi:hypothetical protein